MHYDSRRTFLKNTTFAALGTSLLSHIASTENTETKSTELSCDPTTLDLYGQGPFYTDNPPILIDGILANESEPGERMIITGRVRNLECNEFLPNTIIDIWHADDAGAYDNSGFKLRGITTSNTQGFYSFETIKPGKYLNGSQFRPSHIHFKITPPGFPVLTTQLYFEGDSSIPTDAAASKTSGPYDASNRIIPLNINADGILEGTWDIVVDGDGIVSTNDIHIDKGIIYNTSPNPFNDSVDISYSVYKKSEVGLLVFDSTGQEVAVLESKSMVAGKYLATWQPGPYVSAGIYYIVLKVNDLQIHHLKIVKKD